MLKIYQYERDGRLYIEYKTERGSFINVVLDDRKIVVRNDYDLEIVKRYHNHIEILIAPPGA